MSKTNHSGADSGQPAVYQIRIKGHLGCQWAAWFEQMTMKDEANGETTLTGPVIDQAAMHGVLKKIRDLGLPLVSVIPLQSDNSDS